MLSEGDMTQIPHGAELRSLVDIQDDGTGKVQPLRFRN